MTTRPPTIAVLMPVHNADAYIEDAVCSIRNQTFSDFRLFIVDDGSTDGSLDILRRHAAEDRRITLISRPNTGLVRALNEMLDLVRSPLVARMDADDISTPERFQIQVDCLARNPRTVCVGGGIQLISAKGEALMSPKPLLGNAAIQAEALAGRTPISHPAVMMRADALAAVGGYHHDAYPAEDLDLFLRLGEVGDLDNVPETVLRYRMHGESISVRLSVQQIAKMKQACESAWARRGIRGRFRADIRADLEAKPSADPSCPIGANPTAAALAGRA